MGTSVCSSFFGPNKRKTAKELIKTKSFPHSNFKKKKQKNNNK